MQQQWTNSWLNCDVWQKVNFTYQLAMTSSVIGPRRSLKVFSKTKLAPKKVTITIWWSAATVIHYSFLNPSETITSEKYAQQIDEMHRKLQCLLLALVNRKCPVLHEHPIACHTTNTPKVEQIGLWSLASSAIFAWPIPNFLHFFKHLNNFLQGKCFYNQQKAENSFQVSIKSQSVDIYATGINKLISYWQTVLIIMIPILINKDVFEHSYNDLKFTIWNCNYFFISLIVCQRDLRIAHLLLHRPQRWPQKWLLQRSQV